jgi:uncharacterized protein with ParB-like and HNH nuclease domain
MEASPVHIIQYFNGTKQGVIPLFQRPYSWEQKDWETLWLDLMAQYEEEGRGSHFMGAVVSVPVNSVPVGVTKHLVIDGQQRLTTLSLLLAAIREACFSGGDTLTAGIIEDFLINRHYTTPDDLKIVPTQVDRDAYNALVYRKDTASFEECRILQAYRFFLRKLAGKDDDEQPIAPAQVLQAIQQSLQVVMINLSTTDDPYLIFESLNHKGKPLSQSDLVRNYVLMRFQHSTSVGGEQEAVYLELWRPMEDALKENMSEFLRHYGMRKGTNVRKGDIYTASKSEFEKLKDAGEVRIRLSEMKIAALSYEKFLKPDLEANPRISRRLGALQELDSTVFYPLLLRLYRYWQNDQLTSDGLVDSLDALESFYVRRMTCGVPTNALNKIAMEICAHLPETSIDTWLREKLGQGSGGRRWPQDDEFQEALIVRSIYTRRRLARYMLIALEEAFEHKEPIDTTTATIEHIMPQTLNAAWKSDLGPEFSDIHERWLDTLGNLTLTGYNSELGNDPFEVKKTKLANTHFEMTKPILENDKWGADEIKFRAASLASKAVIRWKR